VAAPLVVNGSGAFPAHGARPVVTIGNFDGVHLGHRALIAAARALALPQGAPVCVYTFDPAPRDVMAPGHGVPAIQSVADRVRWLGELGVELVVVEPFTRAYAGLSAESFARDYLGRRLRASGVVVGWDFRFGEGRRGDHELLRGLLDVPVCRVEAVELDGEVVSSTAVRRAVSDGQVSRAARLLGRPHEVVGPVVHGDGRGRTLGLPTGNVQIETALRPKAGVYAVWARIDEGGNGWWPGVANLGVRPTVGEGAAPLEVHLIDREVNLYGERLRVGFVERIREERRFPDLEALVLQVRQDVDTARRLLGQAA
jgi:riboflavin kinase/FMN adenylyltransferase